LKRTTEISPINSVKKTVALYSVIKGNQEMALLNKGNPGKNAMFEAPTPR
jgi:hypothetical protein